MFQNVAGFRGMAQIERRAGGIVDPVERLRYLRVATIPAIRARKRRWPRRLASALLAFLLIPLASDAVGSLRTPAAAGRRAPRQAILPASEVPEVWQVEQTRDFELYSNGLRLEKHFEVANEPRSYPLLPREGAGKTAALRRSQPAGIVFHTTESDQAPFEAGQNHNLNRIGQELLRYVRNKRAYHFVIDRFGRIFRIVVESDTAFHAGHSIWADDRWIYLDLNASFLGVAFEARTQTNDTPVINQAQLHSARLLVDMLRHKYRLSPVDCVTHAQVSVNPDNMRIGWHTDWGAGFPFRQLGLPENYEYPNPGMALFGFEYDDNYRNSTSPQLWRGLAFAEEQMRHAAVGRSQTLSQYRRLLQKRYREMRPALRDPSAPEVN